MRHNYKHLGLALLLLAGVSLSASAEEKGLVITAKSGDLTKLKVTDVQNITFDGNTMNVHMTSGDRTFIVDDIEEMHFDLTTSIDDINADLGDLKVTIAAGVMTVTADAPVAIKVYGLNGIVVASASGNGSASVDLNTLAKGVYVVKANNKVIKVNR